MPVRWFRNFWLKVGLIAGAGLGTLGFYGLIQAHPLAHSTSSTNDTASSSASSAPAQSAPTQAMPPSSSNGGSSSISPNNSQRSQQPLPTPIPRRRMSRGS